MANGNDKPSNDSPIILPRVWFLTDSTLMNRAYPGAIGTTASTNLILPAGMVLKDFLYDFIGHFDVNFSDSFGRFWQNVDNDSIPMEEWSVYPGSGEFQPPKLDRFIDDPEADRANAMAGRHIRDAIDTTLYLNFVKTVAAASTLNVGLQLVGPWSNPYVDFPVELQDEKWWAHFHRTKKPWRGVFSTAALDGVTLQSTGNLRVTTNVFIYGMSFSGGADITVNIRSTDQVKPAGYLTANPFRIDLLGPIQNNRRAYRWPGVYYVRQGYDLQIAMTSLAGAAIPIDEQITFWGWAVDWHRFT